LFKKLILTFIGIALLLGFQASTASASYYEKLMISDAIQDSENSKSENCELEDWKFFSHATADFLSFRTSANFVINGDYSLQKNFLEVPTSPPNA